MPAQRRGGRGGGGTLISAVVKVGGGGEVILYVQITPANPANVVGRRGTKETVSSVFCDLISPK